MSQPNPSKEGQTSNNEIIPASTSTQRNDPAARRQCYIVSDLNRNFLLLDVNSPRRNPSEPSTSKQVKLIPKPKENGMKHTKDPKETSDDTRDASESEGATSSNFDCDDEKSVEVTENSGAIANEENMERGGMEPWYLESQALNISTNYELVVFAMAMFSQQNEGGAVGGQAADWKPGTFRSLDHDTLLKTCAIEAMQECYDKNKVINSPDSNDSGIQADDSSRHSNDVQHVVVNDDVYAVVCKKGKDLHKDANKSQQEEDGKEKEESAEEEEKPFEVLPPGWEKHDDESGPYYWHIKSGTIQREPPEPQTQRQVSDSGASQHSESSSTEEAGAQASSSLEQFEGHALKFASESIKSLSKKTSEEKVPQTAPIRFAVRSLGWVRIDEEDLTPERSSKAVNKCIVDLSLGRHDINDVVGRWGDGKDLFMDLDEEHLSLIDPQDMSILNVQPIHSIRVWGVGRDNGRDFAYVARDRLSRRHMCHVFRCDTPARQIANTLRDICKKIMMQRQLQQAQQASTGMQRLQISRPTDLPNLVKDGSSGEKLSFADLYKSASFPTPMEEPKKVIRCHYLGTAHVARPTDKKSSVDILNSAMEKVYARVPPEKWVFTSVAIAPSTITISEHGKDEDNVLAECRVRFLSFMGIAMRNVKLCSFIMHTAQDQFVAHVFHCEPSAGALCKTIEAACKLRYQKCLDAHQIQMQNAKKQEETQQNKQNNQDSPTSPLLAAASSTTGRVATAFKSSMQNMIGIIKKKMPSSNNLSPS